MGIDIKSMTLDELEELAEGLKLDCEFMQRNVYELSSDFDSTADLALITIGVLAWLPDLVSFFEIVSRSLKPNGLCLIHEVHPFMNIFDGQGQIDPESRYFNPGPYRGVGDLDYFGKEPYGNCESCCFNHTMSMIINSMVTNGLQIKSLEEFPDDNAYLLDRDSVNELGLPMTCVIVARKGAIR